VTAARRGVLAVAAAALLWSTGGLGIKAVDAPPLAVACGRSAVAAAVLLLFFRRPPRLTLAFGVAVASYAGVVSTFVIATKWTTAANAIFLQYGGVALVVLLAPAVLGEPLRRRDLVATSVAFAGMALFFVGKLDAPGRAGDLVALLSATFWAVMVLALRRLRDGGGEAAVTWGNVLTALALLPFVELKGVGAGSAGTLGLLGAFQLALPYVLFVRGVRAVPAAEAALVGMLEPVANPLWVWLLVGERPAGLALVGGAVVLGAIAWRTAPGRARGDRVPPASETARST
jgi:drug/metabolite transporter (DMT)-like permease